MPPIGHKPINDNQNQENRKEGVTPTPSVERSIRGDGRRVLAAAGDVKPPEAPPPLGIEESGREALRDP